MKIFIFGAILFSQVTFAVTSVIPVNRLNCNNSEIELCTESIYRANGTGYVFQVGHGWEVKRTYGEALDLAISIAEKRATEKCKNFLQVSRLLITDSINRVNVEFKYKCEL